MNKTKKITRLYAEIRGYNADGSIKMMHFDDEDLMLAIRTYAGACEKAGTILADCFGIDEVTESLLKEMVHDDFLYMTEWNMNEMCVSRDFIKAPNNMQFYVGKYTYYL